MTARWMLVGLLIVLVATPAIAVDESLRTRALILKAEDERDFTAAVLRSALASPDPGLRGRAVRAFGRIGDARAVPLVSRRLTDAVPSVRHEAAFALGEIESPTAFDSLRAALIAGDGELAGRSAEALAKLKWKDPALKLLAGRLVVEALLAEEPASAGAGPEAQRRALEVVWRFGKDTPGLVEALVRLDGKSAHLRPRLNDAVVYCAARLRDPRLGELLAMAAAGAESPTARGHAARGLGALAASAGEDARSQAVRKVLIDLAHRERSWRVAEVTESPEEILVSFRTVSGVGPRVNALRALGSFPAPSDGDDAHAAVSTALSSTDAHLQREALGLVAKWKVSRALPAVRGMLTQSDRPDLQAEALAALVALEPAQSRPAVERFASSDDWHRRAAAAQVLAGDGLGGTPEGAALLDALLLDDDPRVVAPATDSAARSGRDDAVVLVLAQLTSRDPVVRAIAASHLPSLVGPLITTGEAASALRGVRDRARGESPPDARLVALDALVELLGPAARRDVAAALQDPDFTVRLEGHRQAQALGLSKLAEVPVGPTASGRPLDFYLEVARAERAGGVQPLHLVTQRGVVDLDLYPAAAPLTVRRFLELAGAGWFDGISFHRIVPDFVVQGGCPRGDGWGGPDESIRCEINDLRYDRGMLGMALSGKDTGGSQFFVTLAPQPHLDGGYTIFGRVRPDSMAVVDQLRRFDLILAALPGSELAAKDGAGR
jgi:cyclophilin family peptidyl-prolyl cis-trans isomerase/HEAT repeat protein